MESPAAYGAREAASDAGGEEDGLGAEHPVARLDDVVQQRYRFGIMAMLSSVRRADFASVRDTLGLTDGNLNRHLAVLQEHGFVAVTKSESAGRRTRTWVRLTSQGRSALDAHVLALRSLIDTIR